MNDGLPDSESDKRRCAKCGEWFPVEEFYPKRKQNTLQSYCRACCGKTSHTWAINNRARRAEYARKYRRIRAFNRVWEQMEEQQRDKRI